MKEVKRYRLSYSRGVHEDDGSFIAPADCSEPMVRASDYDSLLRKFAEVERDAALFRMLQAHIDREPSKTVFSVYEYGTRVFALAGALERRAAIDSVMPGEG